MNSLLRSHLRLDHYLQDILILNYFLVLERQERVSVMVLEWELRVQEYSR